MQDYLDRFLETIHVGEKQSRRNMVLYCLIAAEDPPVDFISLDRALENDGLSITEKDEGGSVPELMVRNRCDRRVLLMDGEELVGAKQNRVLNVTVLLAPQTETLIPVSCVEQGRWSYTSREFASAKRSMSPDLKKKKSRSVRNSIRLSGTFASAQREVWEEIGSKFERMEMAPTPTMALSDLYEAQQESSEDYVNAFHPVENQVGMAVFIDGKLAGIELLAKHEAFKDVHGKLVQSYAMDALETSHLAEESEGEQDPVSDKTVSEMLSTLKSATVELGASPALGQYLSVESSALSGSGLVHDEHVLQLTVFLNDDESGSPKPKGSMRRASARRSQQRR